LVTGKEVIARLVRRNPYALPSEPAPIVDMDKEHRKEILRKLDQVVFGTIGTARSLKGKFPKKIDKYELVVYAKTGTLRRSKKANKDYIFIICIG